ncbi:methylated-DNA--[protein]-cysteine S-methyltransferase [Pedobacter sp. MW01-1-1]|uniref:methylated-DNA--[protein]-cysteine S-methyltransferase n=1 Tax=Pedobacter sp. MW01-1-1 TaxID=3383027 RepID=UPI003FF1565F
MENLFASYLHTPIGILTILADEHFVHEVTFAESNHPSLAENTLTKLVATQFEHYFKGTLRSFDFPIKQIGTDFQQGVWENLLHIPYGETRSYAQFSAHKPLAIRAIAAANGKNKIAIAVPCHRVIGSNGKLVGYAGGLWRKQWLLEHEQAIAQKGQIALKF